MSVKRTLFGTDGIRGKVNVHPMTADTVLKVGRAAKVLFDIVPTRKRARHSVIIGKDTRASCYTFEYALAAGLCSVGADVYLLGPMPTPAVGYLVRSFAADFAIMITASHNPAGDNGIKFFGKDGYKLSDEKEAIVENQMKKNEEIVSEPVKEMGKAYKREDARERYIEYVKNSVRNVSLENFKIVLDCANGAGYRVAPLIFQELGAEVIVINAHPNGTNINKDSGSEYPQALQARVVEEWADIGIALDGDADRLTIVDETGAVLGGEHLLASAALAMKRNGKLSRHTVVTTEMANAAFDVCMQKHDINVVRTRVGDRYLIENIRSNGYVLGGEPSGHVIFKEFSTTGDGILAALHIVNALMEEKRAASEIGKIFESHPQTLCSVAVRATPDFETLPRVHQIIRDAEKAMQEKGRVLVRYSGTQQLCRILVESLDETNNRQWAQRIQEAIHETIGI